MKAKQTSLWRNSFWFVFVKYASSVVSYAYVDNIELVTRDVEANFVVIRYRPCTIQVSAPFPYCLLEESYLAAETYSLELGIQGALPPAVFLFDGERRVVRRRVVSSLPAPLNILPSESVHMRKQGAVCYGRIEPEAGGEHLWRMLVLLFII